MESRVDIQSDLCLYIPGKVSDSCWVMSEVLLLRGRGLSPPPSSSSAPHSDSWHSSTSDGQGKRGHTVRPDRSHTTMQMFKWSHSRICILLLLKGFCRHIRTCTHAVVMQTLVLYTSFLHTAYSGRAARFSSMFNPRYNFKCALKHNHKPLCSKYCQNRHRHCRHMTGRDRRMEEERWWSQHTWKYMQALRIHFTWESVRASRVTRRDTRQERAHSVEQHRNAFSSGQSLV